MDKHQRKSLNELLDIMVALRDPDTGCPWDKVQTFKTIAPYTIEEAYEVADAIERGDLLDLEDELGDLLLQVVYHARIAEELGAFEFADVTHAIATKMLRRHPHVFGTDESRDAVELDGLWDRTKAEEKAERQSERERRHTAQPELYPPAPSTDAPEGGSESLLDTVPTNLPGLAAAVKLQHKAAKVGFDWPTLAPVFAKLAEELQELRVEVDRPASQQERSAIEDELGDVLFVLANIARHLDVDPDAALRKTNAKFRKRFGYIEQELLAQGKPMTDGTLDEMESLWQDAKTRT